MALVVNVEDQRVRSTCVYKGLPVLGVLDSCLRPLAFDLVPRHFTGLLSPMAVDSLTPSRDSDPTTAPCEGAEV